MTILATASARLGAAPLLADLARPGDLDRIEAAQLPAMAVTCQAISPTAQAIGVQDWLMTLTVAFACPGGITNPELAALGGEAHRLIALDPRFDGLAFDTGQPQIALAAHAKLTDASVLSLAYPVRFRTGEDQL